MNIQGFLKNVLHEVNGTIKSLGNKGLSALRTDIFTGKDTGELFPSFRNLWNGLTGNALQDSQIQAMDLQNKNQLDLLRNKYKAEVEGMSSAGLNPALMYSNGSGQSVQSAAPAAASQGGLSSLLALFTNLMMNVYSNKTSETIAKMNNATQLKLQKNDQQFQSPFMQSNKALTDFQAKGQEILNRINDLSSPYQIGKIRADYMLTHEQYKNALALRSNLIDTGMLLRAQTSNEYLKQGLIQAEQYLNKAQAWQIYSLAPIQSQLMQEQIHLTNEEFQNAYENRVLMQPLQRELLRQQKQGAHLEYQWQKRLYTSKEFGPKMYRSMQYGLGTILTFGVGAAGAGAMFKSRKSTPTNSVVPPSPTPSSVGLPYN